MRDELPKKIRLYETAIINLDRSSGDGTHWTAYVKKGSNIIYFDSIGQMKPPPEVLKYFHTGNVKNHISYNFHKFQKARTYNCGELVLKFLYDATKKN